MKELSLEQKAKRYDEALERARTWKDKSGMPKNKQGILDDIFPELAESEDERIRKEIMDFIDTKTINSDERRNRWFSYLEKYKPIPFTSLEDTKVKMSLMQYISELNQDVVHLHPGIETCNEWLAWLEKQGEPKFKMGDLVIDKQGIVHQIANVIENVTYHTYGYDIVGGGYFNDNTEGVRLWTIADAKDGDVLACNEEILLFKSYSVQGHISLYCWYNGQTNNFHSKEVTDASLTTRNKICPATKEQRDLLFQKMKENGYEWDSKNKKLILE